MPPLPGFVQAEAKRPPVALPKSLKAETIPAECAALSAAEQTRCADTVLSQKLIAKLRASELGYRRAVQGAAAHNARLVKQYNMPEKKK